MNYFEHHIGDYDQATAHLSGVEDGMYHRLIRRYMATERPLPADLPALQRLVRAHTREEKKAVQTLLAEFFELQTDGYHQHRCDEEIARFQEKSAKAKRSAEARWGQQRSESDGNANAYGEHDASDMRTHDDGYVRQKMRTHSERNALQTPNTKHQKENTPDPLPGFVEFWSVWPRSTRKGGKAECEKLWRSGRLESVKTEILAHVRLMASTQDWTKENGAFIPAPAVYLRQKRWDGAEDGSQQQGGLDLPGGAVMRGLDQLQQVRREGYRPDGLVSFSAMPMAAAAISADAWDSPELADLRAFKGLSVVVYGHSFDPADAWAKAIAEAGAFDVVLVLLHEDGITPVDGTPAILKFHGEMLA